VRRVLSKSERKDEACGFGLASHVAITILLIFQAILLLTCQVSNWDIKAIAVSVGCPLYALYFYLKAYFEGRNLYYYNRHLGGSG